MKAVAVVAAKREVRLIEHEEPQVVQPTDVRLRVLEIGVCGIEREICSF